jgi:7,8-dihydropterin-6-yl-methyl-4-(beta-D-ribofuranosyl)aminobenzene 5'-phosphate synthase
MISVTLLCENTARGAGILGEHGLAFWIDTGAHRVLFDTGQGLALPNNARRLGIDLATADAIVISHGHYDHVGGLAHALAAAPVAVLHLHPAATEAKFSGSGGPGSAPGRRLSLPILEEETFRTPDRRVITDIAPHEVVPGVRTTGEIPRCNDFEDTGGPFYLDAELTRPDPLRDEQSLYLTTAEGIVLLCGLRSCRRDQHAGARRPAHRRRSGATDPRRLASRKRPSPPH